MSFRGKLSILMVSVAVALYAAIGGILSPWARAQQPINDSGAQLRIFESDGLRLVFSIFTYRHKFHKNSMIQE